MIMILTLSQMAVMKGALLLIAHAETLSNSVPVQNSTIS